MTTMIINPAFLQSSCLVKLTKISGRTNDKIKFLPNFRRSKFFKRIQFNFINWFEAEFEANMCKNFRDFERDGIVKS